MPSVNQLVVARMEGDVVRVVHNLRSKVAAHSEFELFHENADLRWAFRLCAALASKHRERHGDIQREDLARARRHVPELDIQARCFYVVEGR